MGIEEGDFDYNDPVWEEVSCSAKVFINKLLAVDPENRWSAKEALQKSRWLNSDKRNSRVNKKTVQLRRSYERLKEHVCGRQQVKGFCHSIIPKSKKWIPEGFAKPNAGFDRF